MKLSILTYFLFTSAFVNAQIAINDSLVAHYLLNGNAVDASGNGFNGALQNSPASATDRFGNSTGCLDFNGSNQYIALPDDFDYSERTVTAWFNADTILTTPSAIYNSDHPLLSSGNTIINSQKMGGVEKIRLQAGGLYNETPVDLNDWYFASITYSNDSTKVYLNGELVQGFSSMQTSSSSAASPYVARIGAGRNINNFFNGLIDDVRIYNRAINAQEVAWLYCPVNIQINSNDTMIELGNSFTFESFEPANYISWYLDGMLVSTDSLYNHTFSDTGIHQLVISESDGYCERLDTIQIQGGCLSASNIAQNDTLVMAGASIYFSGPSAGSSVTWLLNGTPVSTDTATTINFNDTGVYQLVLHYMNDLCQSFDTVWVEVYCPVVASIVNSDTSVFIGNSIVFNLTQPNITQSWYLNGVLISTDTIANITVMDTGVNEIVLVQSNDVCESSDTVHVQGIRSPDISGIAQHNDYLISLYPNPSHDLVVLNTQGELLLNSKLTILNAMGQVQHSENILSTSHVIDISKLAAGTYFLQVSAENSSVVRESFVKVY